MKIKLLLIVALGFCLANMLAQVYPASNFTMAGYIDPEPGTGLKYSANWGWTHPVSGKEFAIAFARNGTYFVDITTPSQPSVSAYVAGTSTNAIWREGKTYQNYLYIVPDDGTAQGLQIIDLSPLPSTVNLVHSNTSILKRGHTCWVDGNKLYVSSVTYSNGAFSSLNVYSLATPTAPVLLRQLKDDYGFIGHAHDCFVRNDTCFASCGNQGLFVFKFNTQSNTFTQIGSLTSYTAQGYNHASALTPNGQYLVMLDEVPASLPIKIVDVTNLGNMQVLATMNQFPQTTPHNPFMINNQYCFVSAYRDGCQLWDISNPNAPFLAGYFDTHPQKGGNNNNWSGGAYDGLWSLYPYYPSKTIFCADEQNGLFFLKSHLYANPEMDITGNGQAITDGAITTNTNNNTDFGSVNVGSSLIRNYSINNTYYGTLTVNSYSISGANAAEFVYNGPATPFTVAPNSSVSFSLTFSPSATGSRSAQVIFNNNDLNEGTYDFSVEGNGNAVNTGLNQLQNGEFELSFFPNPAKNEVEFSLPSHLSSSEISLRIFDATGKLVATKQGMEIEKSSGSVRKINISELVSGNYSVVMYEGQNKLASKKLIVSK